MCLLLILFYELVGVIVRVGNVVVSKLWKVGDCVGVLNFKSVCGSCIGCVVVKWWYGGFDLCFCENREIVGFYYDGVFVEYLVVDLFIIVKFLDDLLFE